MPLRSLPFKPRCKKKLFFDHVDDANAARVVEHIHRLTAHGIGNWTGERSA